MNLLDLNNDVLNIIGNYVKRNNEVEEIFTRVDKWTNYLIKKIDLVKTICDGWFIINYMSVIMMKLTSM